MALERIVLNIIPAGEMPVFHCSQYENGRPVIIDLVSSDDDAFLVPEGATVELHCRKVDDNIVTLEPDEVDNNTVTFVSTEQLTACPGDNLCEVVLYADTDPVQTIATLNFILHVEPDPLEGGLTSETQIYNLTEQIEEITQQVIGDDYYDKTEVDDLLDDKADKATTYTKSEVDSALNLKADKSNTYTKTQVDSALALKADVSDLPDMTDYYTKSATDALLDEKADANTTYTKDEVDALIDNIFPTLTASGTIATFTTALTKSLVSVTVDPSATNITLDSKNLLEIQDFSADTYKGVTFSCANGVINANGTATSDIIYVIKPSSGYTTVNNIFDVKPDIQYVMNGCLGGAYNSTYWLQLLISGSGVEPYCAIGDSNPFSFTTAQIASQQRQMAIRIKNGTVMDNVKFYPMIRPYAITDNSFEQYNGQTVPVSDATTLVTKSGINNVFADVGDVTVQYKYMSM